MEVHLRKITRCLGGAVEQLEVVSTSEKTTSQVDEEWMAHFHAGIVVPAPCSPDVNGRHPRRDGTVAAGGQDDHDFSDQQQDPRWRYLKSTWLPLLRDLHRTVEVLDREENELQAAELQKEREKGDQKQDATGHDYAGGIGGPAGRPDRAPPRPPKGLLSLRDHTVIHAALEIVVHWGLIPVFESGVGVFEADKRPRSRAVKISRRILHYWGGGREASLSMSSSPRSLRSSDSAVVESSGSDHDGGGIHPKRPKIELAQESARQLAVCTDVIQEVVTAEQFVPMLMPLYLPDLLAARLQLVYGNTAANARAQVYDKHIEHQRRRTSCPPMNDASISLRSSTTETNTNIPMSTAKTPSTDNERLQALRAILKFIGPRQVMSALRQLLSQGTRAPLWLRQRAGRILSEIVLRPGGVQATLEVYLAGAAAAAAVEGGSGAGRAEGDERTEDDERQDEIKACLRVAKLLATPPKRVSPRIYVSRVAPQLAEMLHFNGQQRALITRVVVMIIGMLSEPMPEDTLQLVLRPLLRPLLLFWGPGACRPDGVGRIKKRPRPSPASSSSPANRLRAPSSPSNGSAGATAEGHVPIPANGEKCSEGNDGSIGGGVSGVGGGWEAQGGDISSEEALGRGLEDLEKLLTAAPAPPPLLRLLSGLGVMVPLFRLHCFCKKSKSRNLWSTTASLSALLCSSTTAAADFVAGLLPSKNGWQKHGEQALFGAGPTGGCVLRLSKPSARGSTGGSREKDSAPDERGMKGGGTTAGRGSAKSDESLLGLEAALEGLGLDPETLRLVGSTANAMGGAEGFDLGGGGELMNALAGLKEAESRARDAAEVLEELGEGSPVAGKVFDMLLRRYLSLRDGTMTSAKDADTSTAKGAAGAPQTAPTGPTPKNPSLAGSRANPEDAAAAAAAVAAEEHAVMASVVVLAEKLGARVFGTGMQILSCIRLVLEHEQPRLSQPEGTRVGVPLSGGDSAPISRNSGRRMSDGVVQQRFDDIGKNDEFARVDAAAALAQLEAEQAEMSSPEGPFGRGEKSVLGAGLEGDEEEGEDDAAEGGDTLCSVVLALLTTVLELGEEERAAEEEQELRAMLGPLKDLAAGHRNAEVAEMSALLCASILSRSLTPEQRREEKERVRRTHGQSSGGSATNGDSAEEREARTARMLVALDAAEEDLRSEAVPIRARGVVTLTRLMRKMVEEQAAARKRSRSSSSSGRSVIDVDTEVVQRLMETYARMAGDSDSYVYLAAVQGLASLADALPKWCIPRLVSLFAAHSTATDSKTASAQASTAPETVKESRATNGVGRMLEMGGVSGEPATALPLSQRLKIGEAVLLSARRCGEAMPTYAHFYVNAFITAAREWSSSNQGGGEERGTGAESLSSPGLVGQGSEAEVVGGRGDSLESKERYHFRASCLSNLAEVCQLLGWSLGRFSQDIVDLGVGILSMEGGESEEATLARRGAAFLLGRLLKGAGGDVLQMLPAAQLRVAYRTLNRSADKDSDEVTRSHARNGLGYLDVAIRSQLFPADGSTGSSFRSSGGSGAIVGGLGATGSTNGRVLDGDGDSTSSAGHHPGITML